MLGGSWVVISGVTSPRIWVISIVTLLITLLITTHEPPSGCGKHHKIRTRSLTLWLPPSRAECLTSVIHLDLKYPTFKRLGSCSLVGIGEFSLLFLWLIGVVTSGSLSVNMLRFSGSLVCQVPAAFYLVSEDRHAAA